MIYQNYQQLSGGVPVMPSYLNGALTSLCPVPLSSHLLLALVLNRLLQDSQDSVLKQAVVASV